MYSDDEYKPHFREHASFVKSHITIRAKIHQINAKDGLGVFVTALTVDEEDRFYIQEFLAASPVWEQPTTDLVPGKKLLLSGIFKDGLFVVKEADSYSDVSGPWLHATNCQRFLAGARIDPCLPARGIITRVDSNKAEVQIHSGKTFVFSLKNSRIWIDDTKPEKDDIVDVFIVYFQNRKPIPMLEKILPRQKSTPKKSRPGSQQK